MAELNIDWSKQHCGVRTAPVQAILKLMPDLMPVIETFPDDAASFSWDVKVHMLMPRQYPCIPHWHNDFVPRVNGIQRFDMVNSFRPMYMWLSNGPLTQFRHGYVNARVWHRFSQLDEHRGTPAGEFGWRCFIRATHIDITPVNEDSTQWLRRHSQVYVDAKTFQW